MFSCSTLKSVSSSSLAPGITVKIFIAAAIIVFVVLFAALIIDFMRATVSPIYSTSGASDKSFRSAVTFDKFNLALTGIAGVVVVAIYLAMRGLEWVSGGEEEE